jgi:hypothetical protein
MNFKLIKLLFFIIETIIVPIFWSTILIKFFKFKHNDLYLFIVIIVLLCHITNRFIKNYRDRWLHLPL